MGKHLQIRSLDTMEDMMMVEALQAEVWPGSEADVVPGHILITLAHNGGVLLGAFDGERLVGFVLGFLGVDSDSPERVAMARLKHCSHMLGVHPDYQGRGVGFQLKLAQRLEVHRQGIRLITWTYDPLQSPNANLNIRKLGGVVHMYLPEAYGTMRDGLNQGLPSDRFLVEWWVTSPRVVTRIEGTRPPLDLAHFLAAGALKVNPATLDESGLLHPAESLQDIEGNLVLVEIPPDFNVVKAKDMGLALHWRNHTRVLFQGLFSRGYLVSDFVHLQGERYPRSYYVLINGEGTLG